MKREQEVQLVVWPTEEPEMPPKPKPPAPAEVAQNHELPTEESPIQLTSAMKDLPAGVQDGSTHAYVWENAAAAAGVVRTMIHRDEGGSPGGPLAGMSSRQVVAALMAGLGVEVGSAVLKHLRDEADVQWVGCAVAEEPEVKHGIAMHALEALRQHIEAGDYLQDGGSVLARDLLERAFGSSRARRLLHSGQHVGFHALENVAPEQIAPFISHEHPQTIALILSQLGSRQASGILAQLPERMQADVAYRITTMENITPAVLLEIEEALEACLGDILAGNQDVGGPKVVADILNLTGPGVEKNVLDQMDAQDPEVAEAVRNLMFTFADIDKMTDRELQMLDEQVDQKDWVISLKGAGEGLKKRLLGLMPEEERTFITAEMERVGPMRLSEVEEVQLRVVVQRVRELEEQGKVTIVRGDSDDTFV